MNKDEKRVVLNLIAKVFIFVSVVIAVSFGVRSLWHEIEWKCPALQTSEYMQGIDGDNFISALCELHGIDPNNRTVSYQIQCPKCNDGWFLTDEVTSFEWGEINPNRTDAAFVKVTPDGSILANFFTTYATIDKLSPGEEYLFGSVSGHTYCGSCGYPIGTDWGVYDLQEYDRTVGEAVPGSIIYVSEEGLTIIDCTFITDPNEAIRY